MNSRDVNGLFRAGLMGEYYYRMRYEDLVIQPEAVLSQFLERIGLQFEKEQLSKWKSGNHHIGGNHMAKNSQQDIRLDTRYLEALSLFEWYGTGAIQASVLRRFKYSLRRSVMRRQLINADSRPHGDDGSSGTFEGHGGPTP